MNTEINTNMYVIVFFLLGLAIIIKLIGKSPTVIGKAGEKKVARILHSLPREYKVLNNVIIPNSRGTTQIDHLVISPYGIFVIETKNYSGWIFGFENSEQWKQTFKTTKGHFFYNPIRQNWGHINSLSHFLQLDKNYFIPIVVFSNDAKLKKIEAETTSVINMYHLKRVIKGYRQQILSVDDVNSIYASIMNTSLVGAENEKQHIQSVKNRVIQKENALRAGRCPRCGNSLVLRKGKYGNFYGCSSYPRCKFTQNIR